MTSVRLLAICIVVIVVVVAVDAFSKNSLSKDKNARSFSKHPISRRVLRFERSVTFDGDSGDSSGDFPLPNSLPYFTIDFAKIQPDIPVKTKPSDFPDVDYIPQLEF